MAKKETIAELAMRLELRCRALHRARGSVRLMHEVIDAVAGTATLHVLDKPVLKFLTGGEVQIIDASYQTTPLRGLPDDVPFCYPVSHYVTELVSEAAQSLREKSWFGLDIGTIGRGRLTQIKKRVTGKLLATLWGLNLKSSAIRCFYSHIWRHINRDDARLTFRLEGGRGANLRVYQQIRAYREVLLELEQESPQLLPLITHYCAGFTTQPDPLPLDSAVLGRICAGSTSQPDLLPLDRAIFGRIKERMKTQDGLTEAGWRVLTRMGAGGVFPWRSTDAGKFELLNLLGSAGPVKVPATLLRWYRNCRIQHLLTGGYQFSAFGAQTPDARFPRSVAERILRLALEQSLVAKKRHRLNRFIAEELSLVEDALLADGATVNLPRQLSWGWLMRYQAAWHELQHAEMLTAQQGIQWDSALAEFTHGKFQVVPLTDAAVLYEEGKLMRHCVSSYSEGCLDGASRIFSVRQSGLTRPVATLELRRSKGRAASGARQEVWRLGQVKGFANSKVSKQIQQLAALVARRYNLQSKNQVEQESEEDLAIAA